MYDFFIKENFYLSSANNPAELVASYHSMDASMGYAFKQFTTRLNVTSLTTGYTGSFGVYEPLWVRRLILSVAVNFLIHAFVGIHPKYTLQQ